MSAELLQERLSRLNTNVHGIKPGIFDFFNISYFDARHVLHAQHFLRRVLLIRLRHANVLEFVGIKVLSGREEIKVSLVLN